MVEPTLIKDLVYQTCLWNYLFMYAHLTNMQGVRVFIVSLGMLKLVSDIEFIKDHLLRLI